MCVLRPEYCENPFPHLEQTWGLSQETAEQRKHLDSARSGRDA